MTAQEQLVPISQREAALKAAHRPLLTRVVSWTSRVRANDVSRLETVRDKQEARFVDELLAIGFEVAGTTSDKRYTMPGLNIERVWFRHPDEPAIVAAVGAYNQKKWFYFWTVFDDGKCLCLSNDEQAMDRGTEFTPDHMFVWFPAEETIEASFAYFRQAVDFHRETRTALSITTVDDCAALTRYFNASLWTRAELFSQLVVGGALLIFVLTFGSIFFI